MMEIKMLTDSELCGRFQKLVRTERKIIHLILECIAEIDRRRLYAVANRPSLYEYLTKDFGYSSGAAMRRISAACLLAAVPELSAKIEDGALNISQLSKVQQAIRTVQKKTGKKIDLQQKQQLLERIENTTQVQTDSIIAEEFNFSPPSIEKVVSHQNGAKTITITFSAGELELLSKAQDLVSHSVPNIRLGECFLYLAKKEIDRRLKMRGSGEKQGKTKKATIAASCQS